MTGSTADLPDPVRQRILGWAAAALGELPAAEVPVALRGVARFAPAKRAQRGAAAIARQLDSDEAFRSFVAQRVEQQFAWAADGPSGDPVEAAARASLLGLPGAAELLDAVAAGAQEGRLRARVAELEQTVAKLQDQLARTVDDDVSVGADPDAPLHAEVDRLRSRLREQGRRLRQLQDAADTERRTTSEELDRLRTEAGTAVAAAADWQRRADLAAARADATAQTVAELRRSAGMQRAHSDRRLELLLSALEQAAAGLRREWDLIGGGQNPADGVAARLAREPSEAERTADPTRLLAWLGLPGAHLIVDGYNVTKTGYPQLSLAAQRDRLIRALAALAARLTVEITVVFDGAAVATARPPGRGVRVLFSAPGVPADDVIRDLVAAEPVGRVLVVASSDREITDAVSRHGARTAAAATLLSAVGG